MTQEERDQILLELKKRQEEREQMWQSLKNSHERIFEIQKENFEMLKNGQEEIKRDLRSLNKSVAKIEVEHGQKLEILLDVVISQPQKFESIEKRFDKHEKRLNKHADEIYYLNSKVQAY